MSSTPAYDESVILALWGEIYTNHQLLCYYPASAIAWPPAGGHAVDLDLCSSLNLDPAVISLMQHLPHVRTPPYRSYDFLDETYQVDYNTADNLRSGRDPYVLNGDDVRDDYLLPQDIMLTSGKSLRGICMILDTRANTIRKFNSLTGPPAVFEDDEREKCERPDDPEHYRNYPAEPAPDVLKRYLEKLRSLEWIPEPKGAEGKIIVDSQMGEDLQSDMKRILEEDYGWPQNFRREDWGNDCERVWEEARIREADRIEYGTGAWARIGRSREEHDALQANLSMRMEAD